MYDKAAHECMFRGRRLPMYGRPWWEWKECKQWSEITRIVNVAINATGALRNNAQDNSVNMDRPKCRFKVPSSLSRSDSKRRQVPADWKASGVHSPPSPY